ncbi:hypothetical protein AVEN_170421-1 [Araneus ventricosus]|uniref:Uncharacterized protein n=1 Tax=Araneus ventricosus TaxID=182803 RepID=A0A4Y2PJB8_ARAVE|nr:hypothetical protein AVEN_170421-1 [Araneus ventricosus]
MSRTGTHELLKHFQDGAKHFQHGVENDDIRNIDKHKNIQDLHSAVRENRRIAICELSEECSITFSSIQPILTEGLGIRRVSDICVLKLFTVDQKENHLSVVRSVSLKLLKMRKTETYPNIG